MRSLTLRCWFLLLCVTALSPKAAAQVRFYTDIDGQVKAFVQTTFSGRIIDSLTREPLPSAVISVVGPGLRDQTAVRNYTTDKKGLFQFTCKVGADTRIEISFLGYKIRTLWLGTDRPEINLEDIPMAESVQGIDDVIVKARMQLYKMKGDTTIYFPKAVKTMEGDKALDILRNMPGVEVSENGSVTILGESVKRTYVNERLLFGEDPTTALKQLKASEIISIKAYNEVDEDDALKHGENAKKRKVLNVVTFEKFSRSIAANVRAEAGTDFGQDPEGHRPARYASAADAGYYSEALQMVVKGEADNLSKDRFGNLQPGSNNKVTTGVSVSGKVGEKHSYKTSYDYSRTRKETWNVRDFIYFPTEYFASKRSADTTRTENISDGHSIGASYDYREKDWHFSTNLSGSFSDNRGTEQQTRRTEQDQALLLATARNFNSHGDGYSFNGYFRADKRFNKKNYFSVSINFRQSDSRMKDLRHESQTTAEGTQLSDLRITSGKPDRSLGTYVRYGIQLAPSHMLSFTLDASASESKDRKLYLDPRTGTLQMALSDDATDQLVKSRLSTSYYYRKNAHLISLSLDYTLMRRNYHNRLFGTSNKKFYQLLDKSASYSYKKPKGTFSVSVSNRYNLPASFNLSSRINDSNPLSLSTGNPALKPTNQYALSVSGSLMSSEGTLDFSIFTTLIQNPITRKRTYFEKNTILPQYDDYVALAGSTLSAPINGNNSYTCLPAISYRTRIAPLMCFIELRADYSYLNSEEDTDTGFGRAQSHTGSFGLSLTSNFSSLVRITLGNRTEGRWYRSAAGYRDRNVRQQLNATLRWDLLKRCVFTSAYTFEVNRFESRIADSDNHILNLSFGCRMLDRKATLSFNAYDILNQTTNLRVSQDAQGISYTWQRIYGSYFTFAFEYKFNNRK